MAEPAATGPCAGIKVLDLSTIVSGPLCGRILGDFGADVIKLEAVGGDMTRTMPPIHRGYSGYFAQYNRNKRGVVVDLKAPPGQAVAQRLAAQVDVVIENFRPGVAGRLGLDEATLRPANRGLIYVSVNGFGDSGPYADQPAYDPVIQGLVGFMPMQGAGGPPSAMRNPVVDKVTAMSAALAILAALNHRHANGGVGQAINVRMLDAWAAFILPEFMAGHAFQHDGAPRPAPRDVYRTFKTRDGHVIGLVLQDSQFRGLCAALDLPALAADPRFADPVGRVENIDALMAALGGPIAALTTAAFLAAARRHDVPFAPVNDVDGFLADPQARHNGAFFDVEDPDYGVMRHLGFMAAFSATRSRLWRRAPLLGEHTDEVLRELGYAPVAIAELRAAGHVR